MKRSAVAAITNGVLALIIAVLGAVCFLPSVSPAAEPLSERAVRRGNSEDGVSLMFNVYWGTELISPLLDVLDEYGAKATFFLGGCWADDNVPIVKEIVLRGHEIGSHGYFHRDHGKLSYAENAEEIGTSIDFLSRAAGKDVTLFAPPSGSYSEETLDACEALDLRMILWSRDTVDWRDKDKALVLSRATKDVKGGELILLHPMEHTLAALPDILSYYKEHGLRAVTVGENIA